MKPRKILLNCLLLILPSTVTYSQKANAKFVDSYFITQLQENESMIIKFGKSGCFNSKKDSGFLVISITRDKANYMAVFDNKKKILNTNDCLRIRKLEFSLDSIQKVMACTNSDRYILQYKKHSKTRIDNTCQWHGFDNLLRTLFDLPSIPSR